MIDHGRLISFRCGHAVVSDSAAHRFLMLLGAAFLITLLVPLKYVSSSNAVQHPAIYPSLAVCVCVFVCLRIA